MKRQREIKDSKFFKYLLLYTHILRLVFLYIFIAVRSKY